MRHPITDEERERGIINVFLLPEQLEALARMMEERGYPFEWSPPMLFGTEEDGEQVTERSLVLTEAGARMVRTIEGQA